MSHTPSLQRPFSLLLVEDNEADVILTKRALNRLNVPLEIKVAGDGIEALDLLRREPSRPNVPLPDFILLDLNMPRMDGRQLLFELKRDEQLKIIPVIILSTSASERDVHDAYRAYASSYLTKPMDFHAFIRRTECFAAFWLEDAAVLPSRT
jgi:two-component system, chemotaxis family, response regulator Rcp1